MKKEIVKKIALIMVAVAILLSAAKATFAVPAALDNLDGLQNIETGNEASATNNAAGNNAAGNKATGNNPAVNKSASPSNIPQTGSNAIIIFGTSVLTISIVAAVMFNKFNNIKLQ